MAAVTLTRPTAATEASPNLLPTDHIADHAEQTALYLDFGANWAAPDSAATARCMVSIAIRIGVFQQLRALADLKSSRPYFACPQRTQRRRGVATSRTNPHVARM